MLISRNNLMARRNKIVDGAMASGQNGAVLIDKRGTVMMRKASDMELMLKGYGLTTARIFYRMPDHPSFLQTFIWQHFDLAPDFPALQRFLDFWTKELDGPLHSVTYTHRKLIAPNEWRNVAGELALH